MRRNTICSCKPKSKRKPSKRRFCTTQRKPRKKFVKCKDGPFEGSKILIGETHDNTLVFSVGGETGSYDYLGRWLPERSVA